MERKRLEWLGGALVRRLLLIRRRCSRGPSARGPLFLDEALDPDPSRTRTSDSGYFFYVDLQPGKVSLSGRDPYYVRMDPVEVGEGAIAVADVEISVDSADE